jgi:predicted amidohydrolase
MTCYDLRFPELARALCDAGATAIAVPAAWVAGPLKEDQWLTLVRARAIESTSYVVAAGQPGPGYCGRSVVVDPLGVVLAGVPDGEGVAVADLDPAHVTEVRRRVPSLQHRRWDVTPRR